MVSEVGLHPILPNQKALATMKYYNVQPEAYGSVRWWTT